MKRLFLITVAIHFLAVTRSQPIVDFSKFPVTLNDTATLFTANLLDKINWSAIKNNSKTFQGNYTYENQDSLLTTYSYIKQGNEFSFQIVSYKGVVMEYHTHAGNGKKENSTSYLNKDFFLKYVNQILPGLDERFQLEKKEPDYILKAYYGLLGIGTGDEYGFICEYGTRGKPTQKRLAIIQLLKQDRYDLIKKLTGYSNLQTKLYAIDALIYKEYIAKQATTKFEQDIQKSQRQLNRLDNGNKDTAIIRNLKETIADLNDSIKAFKIFVLTDDEWQMIYKLRDSRQIVKTCGNMGSYKIYETPVSELLSDKAIAAIPKQYDVLRAMGYFR